MSGLQRAAQLAEIILEQRAEVDRLDQALGDAKATLRRLEQEDLPDLMQELGVDAFRLASGETVDVRQEVDCAITETRRSEAHDWLLRNGFGGLIKTEVVVRFGKGEHAQAVAAAEAVGGELQERVHPSTLKAFVKEQMAAGHPVPFDLFGVHPYHKVRITKQR